MQIPISPIDLPTTFCKWFEFRGRMTYSLSDYLVAAVVLLVLATLFDWWWRK
jgi:hypothetical protein